VCDGVVWVVLVGLHGVGSCGMVLNDVVDGLRECGLESWNVI